MLEFDVRAGSLRPCGKRRLPVILPRRKPTPEQLAHLEQLLLEAPRPAWEVDPSTHHHEVFTFLRSALCK
eukprot:11682701-Alexandrium_andersonii.AAC.1